MGTVRALCRFPKPLELIVSGVKWAAGDIDEVVPER